MGAAGGHMPHPFDLPKVKDGKDLIGFFKEAIKSLKENKSTLKIDGVNASFKLVERSGGQREFVGDRASLEPLDIEGLTANNIHRRFEQGHGMIKVYTNLLNIFNEALPEIASELKTLGMWDNPTLFFNTEYVEGTTNVMEYDHDFLAIHNVGQIYEKKSKKGYRPGIPRPDDIPANVFSTVLTLDSPQERALKSLLNKVKKVAKRNNFKVYGTVPIDFKEMASIDLERVLGEDFTVVYDEDFNDTQTAPLRDWLNIAENPRHQSVTLANGEKSGALSKEIYIAVLNKKSLSHFLAVPEGVNHSPMAKRAIDGAVFYHATRVLGREVLNALTSEMGDAQNHEGVVINDKKRFDVDMVKITGDFILGGMASTFRKSETDDVDPLKCKRTIALIPGAFKPPHKEHLAMVEHYSKIANKVFVFVSPLSRGEKKKDQAVVGVDNAIALWNLYKKTYKLRNVIIQKSEGNSPVQTSMEWIASNYKLKDCILLGASTKPDARGVPDAAGRFDRGGIEDELKFRHDITDEMVTLLDPLDPKRVYTYTVEMSATDFRKAIEVKDYETIRSFLPDNVDENQALAILGIPPEPEVELEPEMDSESGVLSENKKKGVFSSILYGLIEEALNEIEPYQRKVRAKHSRMKIRLITKGGNKDTGGGKGHARPSTKRTKSAPPLGEDSIDDEGLVEGVYEVTNYWTEREMKEIANFIITEFSKIAISGGPTHTIFSDIAALKTNIPEFINNSPDNMKDLDIRYKVMEWWAQILTPWLEKMGEIEAYEDKLKQVTLQDILDFGNILHSTYVSSGIGSGRGPDILPEHEEKINKKIEEILSKIREESDPSYQAFVAGTAGDKEACYEDPNCRELQSKKRKITISISSESSEELEEMSGMGGGAMAFSAGVPRKRKKKKKLEEILLIEEAEATVGQFLATWEKQNPQSAQKILGKAAKYLGGLVVGVGVGAAAGAATGGLGAVAAGSVAAAAGAKLGEEAVNQLFGMIAEKSTDLAKFMITMSDQQVPDDQRTGIANYYDLDDEYEALLQGMDSDLANDYQKHLFGFFKEAFEKMENADPADALSDYLKGTANKYLEHYLFKRRLSGVGVVVKSQVSEELEESQLIQEVMNYLLHK